jgi:hypothetical protein
MGARASQRINNEKIPKLSGNRTPEVQAITSHSTDWAVPVQSPSK